MRSLLEPVLVSCVYVCVDVYIVSIVFYIWLCDGPVRYQAAPPPPQPHTLPPPWRTYCDYLDQINTNKSKSEIKSINRVEINQIIIIKINRDDPGSQCRSFAVGCGPLPTKQTPARHGSLHCHTTQCHYHYIPPLLPLPPPHHTTTFQLRQTLPYYEMYVLWQFIELCFFVLTLSNWHYHAHPIWWSQCSARASTTTRSSKSKWTPKTCFLTYAVPLRTLEVSLSGASCTFV